jgi:hypothetical protein
MTAFDPLSDGNSATERIFALSQSFVHSNRCTTILERVLLQLRKLQEDGSSIAQFGEKITSERSRYLIEWSDDIFGQTEWLLSISCISHQNNCRICFENALTVWILHFEKNEGELTWDWLTDRERAFSKSIPVWLLSLTNRSISCDAMTQRRLPHFSCIK